MPVACFGLEVSFGVNHNQREWKTFSWAFYFYHKPNQFLRETLAVPVACFGLEVSFGVNHNQREWKTFSWAFYFYHRVQFAWAKTIQQLQASFVYDLIDYMGTIGCVWFERDAM